MIEAWADVGDCELEVDGKEERTRSAHCPFARRGVARDHAKAITP